MQTTLGLREKASQLLAADTATLAQAADPNKMCLFMNPATIGEGMVVADLDLATFTGSAPLDGAAGDQQAGIDPLTGDQVITILPPAGGYRWECTAAPASAEVVFGYALTTAAGAALLATKKLATPVTIENVGDFIDLGAVTMRLSSSPLS